MKNFKRVISFILLGLVFATHFIALFHALDHQDTHLTEFSNSLTFKKNATLSEECTVCDRYVEMTTSGLIKVIPYFFITSSYSIVQTLPQDNFNAVVLYAKQSRSPPVVL